VSVVIEQVINHACPAIGRPVITALPYAGAIHEILDAAIVVLEHIPIDFDALGHGDQYSGEAAATQGVVPDNPLAARLVDDAQAWIVFGNVSFDKRADGLPVIPNAVGVIVMNEIVAEGNVNA
jgi:hypothetical protein